MSIHLWQAKISKLLRSKHPEFGNNLENFILDLLKKNGLQWDNDALFDNDLIVDAVYEEFWDFVEPLSSLSEDSRSAISGEFGAKDEIHLNRELVRAWLREVHMYDGHIQNLDNKELQKLYNEYEKDKRPPRIVTRSQEEEPLLFYNDSSSDADFDYWNTFPLWSVEEAVILSFGKDPRVVNDTTLNEKLSFRYNHVRFVKKLKLRLELAERSVLAGNLQQLSSPRDFVTWARDNDIELPDEISLRFSNAAKDETAESIDDLNPVRLSNLYRMIMGMAIESYGYLGDPDSNGIDKRSSAASRISGSISYITENDEGKSLSSEKVREILHTAWRHLELNENILPEKD